MSTHYYVSVYRTHVFICMASGMGPNTVSSTPVGPTRETTWTHLLSIDSQIPLLNRWSILHVCRWIGIGIERIWDRVILVKDCLGISPTGSLTESSHSWYVQYTRISGSEIQMGLQIGKTIDANNRRFKIMMAIDGFLVWKWIVRFGVFLLRDWRACGHPRRLNTNSTTDVQNRPSVQ